MWLAWLALLAYVGLMLGIAIWARRDRPTDDEGYFLGGRSLTWPLLLATMAATNFSAFTVYGSSGAAYRVGLSFLPIMAFGTGFMAVIMWGIGRRARAISAELGAVTAPEIIGLRTGSVPAQKTMAAIFVLVTIPYLALQPRAAGIVVEALFGWPSWTGAVLVTAIVVAYTLQGGLMVVARTDVAQGLLALLLLWAGLFLVLGDVGGPSKAFAELAETTPVKLGRAEVYVWSIWASTLLLWMLADPMFPQLFQRLCAAENDKAIGRMSVLYPLVATLAFIPPILIGVLGHLNHPGLSRAASDNILPTLIVEAGGELFGGLILIAGLAALMSTMDSQLLSAGSFVVRDLAQKDQENSENIRTITVISLAILGLLLSLWSDLTILDLGLLAFTGYAVLFPAVAATLFSDQIDGRAVLASAIAGELMVGLAHFSPQVFAGWWVEPVGPNVPIIIVPAVGVAVLVLIGTQVAVAGTSTMRGLWKAALPRKEARLPILGLISVFILANDFWWWNDRTPFLLGLPLWVWWSFLLSAAQIYLMTLWTQIESEENPVPISSDE